MGIPYSWLALGGLVLAVLVGIILVLRGARSAGKAQVQRDLAQAGQAAQRAAAEAEATARAEADVRAGKVQEGDLNAALDLPDRRPHPQ